MVTHSTAEENLRIIRSLMEKATIYRAISAPTALVGGCGGIFAAVIFYFMSENLLGRRQTENSLFLACWLSALGLAAIVNTWFLRADARRRGEKFVSAGMRAALRALWPSYLVAAVFTILSWDNPGCLPIQWMLLYGLGLLATQHFAPRSIALLGWAFLVAGLLALAAFHTLSMRVRSDPFLGNLIMGLTFGGFHLIYAVCAWPRRSGAPVERSGIADAGNAP